MLRAAPALGSGHRLVRRDARRAEAAASRLGRREAIPAGAAYPYFEASWGLLKRIYR
jgi:hypothetical protein